MTLLDETTVHLAAVLSGERPWGTPTPEEAAALIEAARYHGLGPMLLRQVRQAGVDTGDPQWSPAVRQERNVAVHYELARLAQRSIDAALSKADVPTIWTKGFALCHTIYPEPILRSMGDLDFVVPYDQRREALSVLEGLGYRQVTPELFEGHQAEMHHYHLQGGPAGAVHIEPHYRWGDPTVMHMTEQESDWFWSKRREYTAGDVSFNSLSPEAHLALLALHALAHHGEEEFVLRRYLDMHLLLSTYPDLDWNELGGRATEFGWAALINRALETTSRLFATTIPPLDSVLPATPSTVRETAWLTERPTPDGKLRHALGHVSRMPLSLRLRWGLALVFPTPAYLKWRYDVKESWKVPFLYPWRWLLVAGEMLKTAAGRLRR